MVSRTAETSGRFPALTPVMLLLIMFLHNKSQCVEATAAASSTRDNATSYLKYHGPVAIDEPELLTFDSQISRTLIDYQSAAGGANDANKPVFADCKVNCLGQKYDVPGREKCNGDSYKRNCP